MGEVVSFGSVNVDRTVELSHEEAQRLAERHAWFPDAGETVPVAQADLDALAVDADSVAVGGKGANQASAAAAAGADAAFLGCVGEDAGEYDVLGRLADRGVGVDGVRRVDGPTGTAVIWVTPDGENRIAIVAGANGEVDPGYAGEVTDRVREAGALLLQNEIPVPAATALLDGLADADGGPVVVVDPAPAEGATPLVTHPAVDYVTPNEAEADALGSALDAATARVIRTEGSAGVTVLGRDTGSGAEVPGRETFHVDSPEVEVVDTTGAGDAFDGYLATGLAEGLGLERAVERAVAAGALSTTEEGAATAPAPDAVADLLG